MSDVTSEPYRLWDADNHFYEVRDCFSRHIESKYKDVAIQARMHPDGKEYWHCGDKLLTFCNVKFDKTEAPGSFKEILNNPELGGFDDARDESSMLPAFHDQKARLELMDSQNVEGTILFPSMANGIEQDLLDNPEVLYANLRSYNRWVEEDWGFGSNGRIFGTGCLSLADVDLAVEELDRLLKAGVKVVYLRPAPGGGAQPCSIADPKFDPFWARLEEAKVPVGFHVSAGFFDASTVWGEKPRPGTRDTSALQFAMFHVEIPIMTTLAAMVLHNLFGRFPGLRVISVEHGCGWVPYLLKTINKAAWWGRFGDWPGGTLPDRPSEMFKRNVYVVPFHEDNTPELVKRIGANRVLMGSDYPHAEGLAQPAEFEEGLTDLDPGSVRRITRDNLRELLMN
ncbi:amidohydrolase family protein [Mycobacterium seoulense]|uniref:amidohydrolase family protein n=1 Tax=Mycobacterium seoulense TaxID=386911 RepID=UPI003CE9A0F2